MSSGDPPDPAAEDVKLTPQGLMELYNATVPLAHPQVTRLTPARKAKAAAYLRVFPERSFWVRAFSEIRHSQFLRGERNGTGHASFRADFDWLLTKGRDGSENCVKVAEGKYRDTSAPARRNLNDEWKSRTQPGEVKL